MWTHKILDITGAHESFIRYSLTFREVHHSNKSLIVILGDSKTKHRNICILGTKREHSADACHAAEKLPSILYRRYRSCKMLRLPKSNHPYWYKVMTYVTDIQAGRNQIQLHQMSNLTLTLWKTQREAWNSPGTMPKFIHHCFWDFTHQATSSQSPCGYI